MATAGFDTVHRMGSAKVWTSLVSLVHAHRRAFLASGLMLFALLAVTLYLPSLNGGPVSDDWFYFSAPTARELSIPNAADIVNPRGNAARATMNYAPVHLFAHALAFELLGPSLPLHHLFSVLLHALTAWLLMLLLISAGGSTLAAAFAGLVFLLHPANVEAVTMLFQLKTVLSTALVMAVLLLYDRHPFAAFALFVLAILTKISAVAALPVAAAMLWSRSQHPGPRSWGWLGLWLMVALLVVIPESAAFRHAGAAPDFVHPEPLVQIRTVFAIAMRYLVIAATGMGLSASHQTAPALSWLDPWWLGGLAAGISILLRTVCTLRQRRVEGAFWLMAMAAFAPVSQIFPFIYPMADRYLYAILPGLLGGGLLAAQGALERFTQDGTAQSDHADSDHADSGHTGPSIELVAACGGALVLALGFASQSAARIPVYASDDRMAEDSARHYPDGIQANLARMLRAGATGDGSTAATALRAAFEQGWVGFAVVVTRPSLATVVEHPEFRAVLQEMATYWIDAAHEIPYPVQADEYMLALAHELRDERELAIAAAQRGLAQPGVYDETLRELLRTLEAP